MRSVGDWGLYTRTSRRWAGFDWRRMDRSFVGRAHFRKIFRARVMGEGAFSLITRSGLPIPPHYPVTMCNDSDILRSASTALNEFNTCPFWRPRAATTLDIRRDVPSGFTGDWDTVVQPGSSATVSTSLFLAPSHGTDPFRCLINPCLTRTSI